MRMRDRRIRRVHGRRNRTILSGFSMRLRDFFGSFIRALRRGAIGIRGCDNIDVDL
jgi:hypothetical protein